MHKKLFVGVGLIALAGMVATANAASQTRTTAAPGQYIQLAQGDAAPAAGSEQPTPKKKHKKTKKHGHGKKSHTPAPAPADTK